MSEYLFVVHAVIPACDGQLLPTAHTFIAFVQRRLRSQQCRDRWGAGHNRESLTMHSWCARTTMPTMGYSTAWPSRREHTPQTPHTPRRRATARQARVDRAPIKTKKSVWTAQRPHDV